MTTEQTLVLYEKIVGILKDRFPNLKVTEITELVTKIILEIDEVVR